MSIETPGQGAPQENKEGDNEIVKIEKISIVDDPEMAQELFDIYEKEIGPLNDESPFVQTLPKQNFDAWLKKPEATKIIMRGEGDRIEGMAILSGDIEDDFWLSKRYFDKHYPGKKVLHVPALALRPQMRGSRRSQILARAICELFPENSVCLGITADFNAFMAPLFEKALPGKLKSRLIGSELCTAYELAK